MSFFVFVEYITIAQPNRPFYFSLKWCSTSPSNPCMGGAHQDGSMTKWCHNYVEGITLWLQIAAISNPSAWTVLVLQQKVKSQEKLRLREDVGRYFLAKAKFTCIVSMQCRWTNLAFILTFAIILVYCRPLSTQIIVQTDVVQAIFSHVLMVAWAVRHHDVTRERFNCSCHPCFQGKYCEIGRHDLFFLV